MAIKKLGSVIKATADYTDLTDILEPCLGDSLVLHAQVTKNVPKVKICLDLRIYPGTNGHSESGGSPISHNYAETRAVFIWPIF